MDRVFGILLGLGLAAVAAVLLWVRPEERPLEARAFAKLQEGTEAALKDALELFEEGTRQDRLSPYRWCDLGEALLEAGQAGRARECMKRALKLGPRTPQVWVRASNFYYRLGETAEALRASAEALKMTPAYDGVLFRYYWTMGAGPAAVRESLAANARAGPEYFRYTLAAGPAEEAAETWEWLREKGWAEDKLAVTYVDWMLARREGRQAARTWAEYLGQRRGEFPGRNRVFNGDFEMEATGAALDWRLAQAGKVTARRDGSVAQRGRWSWRIEFAGDENVRYGHTWQDVYLEPGTYRLRAMVKTEGLTTDRGVALRVVDAEAPARLDARTRELTGTQNWTLLEAAFRVGPGTNVARVVVIREPSMKFDNKIAGTAWIDAVSVQPAGAE